MMKKMLESRPEDTLINTVKTVEIVETAGTVETVETGEMVGSPLLETV